MELFPYDTLRPVQEELVAAIEKTIEKRTTLIAHAPTGLGKTVASLVPALKKAEEEELTIFFLTSRHTQHKIAIDTLQAIKEKHGLSIPVVDLVGKKHMCLQGGIDLLSSGEFSEFCKKLREEGRCEYYSNARKENGEATMKGHHMVQKLYPLSPLPVEKVVEECEKETLCPYEISMLMAKKAKVVIADYHYLFNPGVMQSFFNKTGKELEDTIVVVDEAHNLPSRLRDVMTKTLSTLTIKFARHEANEWNSDEALTYLDELQAALLESIGLEEEQIVKGLTFPKKEEMIELFETLADQTREEKKRSHLGTIASFLNEYKDAEGFVNIARHIKTQKGERIELKHSCLDPSIVSQQILDMCYAAIVMSGTLEPVGMYQELLGASGEKQEFSSPFPEENKLSLIVPTVTTKFSARSIDEFKKTAKIIGDVIDEVPGNTAIFFPSYHMRDNIAPFIEVKKTVFQEVPGMGKQEREELIERFKEYQLHGAALLGVATGSFGEGIDLPGDLLKCVVIVGLPLSKPDLETQALIDYYQKKYGKGWEYGYVLPALSRVRQNAGRCIRGETDRGVVVYVDRRYQYENYKKCIDENAKISMEPKKDIQAFFAAISSKS